MMVGPDAHVCVNSGRTGAVGGWGGGNGAAGGWGGGNGAAVTPVDKCLG